MNMATALLGFLVAASTVSLVTVSTIGLIKTKKAEKEYGAIENKLAELKNSSDKSDLVNLINENQEKNKEAQKKQKENIELINTEEQLKNDIKDLQAQIEQAKEDLGTATAAKDKLEKAKKTFHEMDVELNGLLALRNDTDVQPLLDSSIWSPILGPAGAAITPIYNDAAANEWAAHKDQVLDLAAAVNGHRTGVAYNAGGFTLASLVAILKDQQGGHATASHVAGGGAAEPAISMGVARQFLRTAWDDDFNAKVNDIENYNKAIKDNTAKLKEKQDQLEALKKKNK